MYYMKCDVSFVCPNKVLVVELLSTPCRENRDFRDCRHTIPAVSTENRVF